MQCETIVPENATYHRELGICAARTATKTAKTAFLAANPVLAVKSLVPTLFWQ
jgi:hypothetical protein